MKETFDPSRQLKREFGIPTFDSKMEYHNAHKISFSDARKKPEFWTVTGLTLLRAFVGAYAVYLAFNAVESSQLALPALLTAASWASDYFDGSYARKHNVCTDLGNFLDHGPADLPMAINTIAIPFFLLSM
jgi:hypothetical protein